MTKNEQRDEREPVTGALETYEDNVGGTHQLDPNDPQTQRRVEAGELKKAKNR